MAICPCPNSNQMQEDDIPFYRCPPSSLRLSEYVIRRTIEGMPFLRTHENVIKYEQLIKNQ